MLDAIRDMLEDGWAGRTILALILLFVIIIPVGIYYAIQENKEWERFKVDHNCKIVAYEQAHTSVGYGTTTDGKGGVVTVTTPSKTSWLCDDGITYVR